MIKKCKECGYEPDELDFESICKHGLCVKCKCKYCDKEIKNENR